MAARLFLRLPLTLLVVGVSARVNHTCRYIPGDEGWPTHSEWARLNLTVGGRLLGTVPVAHVCHQSGPFAAYNRTACEDLGRAFQDAGAATLFV